MGSIQLVFIHKVEFCIIIHQLGTSEYMHKLIFASLHTVTLNSMRRTYSI